jgi:hypothetical protein
MVDDELKRAEDAALPYGAVEAELLVPPLPLCQQVREVMTQAVQTMHTDFWSRLCSPGKAPRQNYSLLLGMSALGLVVSIRWFRPRTCSLREIARRL